MDIRIDLRPILLNHSLKQFLNTAVDESGRRLDWVPSNPLIVSPHSRLGVLCERSMCGRWPETSRQVIRNTQSIPAHLQEIAGDCEIPVHCRNTGENPRQIAINRSVFRSLGRYMSRRTSKLRPLIPHACPRQLPRLFKVWELGAREVFGRIGKTFRLRAKKYRRGLSSKLIAPSRFRRFVLAVYV